MRMPIFAPPVQRCGSTPGSFAQWGIAPSRNVYVTGLAVCKKGANVLFTQSATVCGDEHLACTVAKRTAVQDAQPQCQSLGGVAYQDSKPCDYGAKC